MTVGTYEWTTRTGGRLNGPDLVRFLAAAAASQLALMPGRTAAGLGLHQERLARLDLESMRLPDSSAARDADALCAELPVHIANHSRRSYLWSLALAQHDGLRCDEELLYVGSLLHDHGVPGALARRDECCFTLSSARTTTEVARGAGWPEERTRAVAAAITLHLNAAVSPALGVEAHLMNAGIALDVVGLRRWHVDQSTAVAIVARHPRAGFTRKWLRDFTALAAAAPRTRPAALLRYAGFGLLLRHAPYDE